MKLITILILFSCVIFSEEYTIDFSEENGVQGWTIVNDDVMGGRSKSEAFLKANSLQFHGDVSLENNGGFASIRGPYQKTDLSKFKYVTIRCRGTSRDFAFSLDIYRIWLRPNYNMEFRPKPNAWTEFTFKLSDFKESRVGRYTGNTISEENLAGVIRMGIILFDKKEGPFNLELDYIKFYQ